MIIDCPYCGCVFQKYNVKNGILECKRCKELIEVQIEFKKVRCKVHNHHLSWLIAEEKMLQTCKKCEYEEKRELTEKEKEILNTYKKNEKTY
jgi:hypothetical protein